MQPDLIIAAGGDGTYNEAVNGIAGSGVPMAILPVGTTNVLASELGIPFNVEHAVDRALSGRPHTVHLGRLVTPNKRRLFCFAAGIGFDASVVHGINLRLKRYTHKLSYVMKGFECLAFWNPEPFPVHIDGIDTMAYTAIIAKTRKYAGNYTLAPKADLKTPTLHAFLITSPNRVPIIKFTLGLLSGNVLGPSVHHYECASVAIESEKAPIQLDGDAHGLGSSTVEVAENAIQLIW